jgi:glycosyltransferase involved in cell wall biosynthesis
MTGLRLAVNVGSTKKGTTLGVAHFAANLIDALDRREDVEVVVMGDPDAIDGYGLSARISSEELESDRGRRRAREQIDAVLQIHHFLPQCLVLPTMTIVHDLHLFNVAWKYRHGREDLVEKFEENVLGVDAVISHFPGTIDALASRFPESVDKLHLVASPTLLADFAATADDRAWARRSFGLDDGVPTLLYPAQLQAHKNHWGFVAALAKLRDRGRPVRAICTGSSFREYLTSSLEARVVQRGLTDLVHFAGFVEGSRLCALYEEVDAVVSPSLAEGGAYIAQEAILHSTPVACSDLASVRAHLARLEAEVPLFDPMNVDAMVGAIEDVLDHGERLVHSCERAREVEKSWTWSSVASDVSSLGRRIVDSA